MCDAARRRCGSASAFQMGLSRLERCVQTGTRSVSCSAVSTPSAGRARLLGQSIDENSAVAMMMKVTVASTSTAVLGDAESNVIGHLNKPHPAAELNPKVQSDASVGGVHPPQSVLLPPDDDLHLSAPAIHDGRQSVASRPSTPHPPATVVSAPLCRAHTAPRLVDIPAPASTFRHRDGTLKAQQSAAASLSAAALRRHASLHQPQLHRSSAPPPSAPDITGQVSDLLLTMRSKQHAALIGLVTPIIRGFLHAHRDALRSAAARSINKLDALVESEVVHRRLLDAAAAEGYRHAREAMREASAAVDSTSFKRCLMVVQVLESEARLHLMHSYGTSLVAIGAAAASSAGDAARRQAAVEASRPCRGCERLRNDIFDVTSRSQREERALLATILRKDAELVALRDMLTTAEARLNHIAQQLPSADGAAPVTVAAHRSNTIADLVAAVSLRAPVCAIVSRRTSTADQQQPVASAGTKQCQTPVTLDAWSQTDSNSVTFSDESQLKLADALARAAGEVTILKSQRDRLADTVRRMMELQQESAPPVPSRNALDASNRMPRVRFAAGA